MPMQFEFRIPKATWNAGAAQNAGIVADLALPAVLRGVAGNARNHLRSITIAAQDNHDFEIWLFASATRYPANRDNNKFLGRWRFLASDAVQDASDGTGTWYYYIDGNDVPLRDDDLVVGSAPNSPSANTGKLHITLIDRTAGGLPAGHDVVIELRLAPLSQFP